MADETDFKFDDKLRQQIHYDWGKHYKRLGNNAAAQKQFLDSLSLKENAHGPTEQLSKCHLERGDAAKALDLANQCLKNHPRIARNKYNRNECIYDTNEFESCLVERYRMCSNTAPVLGAVDAIKMTELTLEDSIGNRTGSFLENFREAISELDKIEAETVDTRPLWKIRRDKGECDVLSVCSDSNEEIDSEKIDHPLDLYRSRKQVKNIRSLYFSTPTIETYDFLLNVLNDSRLNFPPSEESSRMIKEAIGCELKIFKIFEKMLHQRHPIYAKKFLQRKNNKNKRKFDKATLSKTQEFIERRAWNQVEQINRMKNFDFPGLLKYVEELLTNFYLNKSERIFPKKIEYIEAICNIVGTCHIDQIQIRSVPVQNSTYAKLNAALNYHRGFSVPITFNVLPGFTNPIDHFQRRLQHSDNVVERCYIYHQLSRLYFEKKKYIESKEAAEELVGISTDCKNYVWMLLGNVRVMLIDAVLGDMDKVKAHMAGMEEWKANVKESVWNFLEKITFSLE